MSKQEMTVLGTPIRVQKRDGKDFVCLTDIARQASINQLICLSNMENLNAVFIHEGLSQHDRLLKRNAIAIQQMKVLAAVHDNRLIAGRATK